MTKRKEPTGGVNKRRTEVITMVQAREEDFPGVGNGVLHDASFVIYLEEVKGPGAGEAHQALIFRDENQMAFEWNFASALEVEMFAAVMRRALHELQRAATEAFPPASGLAQPAKRGKGKDPLPMDKADLCSLHAPKKKPSSNKKKPARARGMTMTPQNKALGKKVSATKRAKQRVLLPSHEEVMRPSA